MLHGYGFVRQLCAELQDFMRQHDFKSIAEFKGKFVIMGVMLMLGFAEIGKPPFARSTPGLLAIPYPSQ